MINFSKEDIISFLKTRPILIGGFIVILVSIGGFYYRSHLVSFFKAKIINYPPPPEVSTPTIIRGDLVLPKVMLDQFNAKSAKETQIHVISAILYGVFDNSGQQANQQNPFEPAPAPKLIGIRIIGEMQNTGKTIVEEISPVIRFLDTDNHEIATKLGRLSPGFDFFGVLPNSKTVYDIMVDDPPTADKMEVLLNTQLATTSAKFDLLKVLNQTIDVKTAVNQQTSPSPAVVGPKISSDSAQSSTPSSTTASASAQGGPTGSEGEQIPVDETPQKIEYYTISGSVVNSLSDPVSDITVYVWVKDTEGHVFSFGRQDFKGDLIAPKKVLDFKINLFPFKDGLNMAKYEVSAWAKRYKL